jgi:phospholipid transport system substrate-binding protein
MFLRIALLTALLYCGSDLFADDADAIARFHATLIEAMQSGGGFDARAALVGPAVTELFDVSTIARVSLGRTWRELDQAAQNEFTEDLTALIVATYADRFSGFNDQRFETLAVDASKPGRTVVKTRLLRSDGEPVALDYYFNGGRVYDIVAEGVSDLSLRRADYSAIVARKGIDGLIADIRTKTADHRVGGQPE